MARINGSVSQRSDSYSFFIDWSESKDSNYTSTNQTTVSATAYIYCSKHTAYASGLSQKLVIDGTEFTATKSVNLSSGVTVALVSGSKTITHDADGRKSITISADCDLPDGNGWGPAWGSASGTAELTTIPRASSISATDANIGSSSSIIINRASSGFTHTVTYSFSGLSGTIATKTSSTSLGWTVPTSFYQKIPNSQTGTVTITCDTYSGDTKIGTKTTTMTISVPESSHPVIDSATAIDTNATTVALTGSNKRLVNYKSTVKLSVTGRCLNYAGFSKLRERNIYDIPATKTTSGATTTVTGTKTYENNTLEQFKICLVDTRNKVSDDKILNQANGDFTVVPYIPLTINAEFRRTTPTRRRSKLKLFRKFLQWLF